MIDPVVIFRALGDETRLRLINLFLQTKEDLCVCEMVDTLKLPQYQISKHLTILKNAGLLKARRKGTWVYYHINLEESTLVRDLFTVLSRYIGQDFATDTHQLIRRLALRESGKCVVGFVPQEELNQLIKNKLEKLS
jgi:ArsR family transcriptional regulator